MSCLLQVYLSLTTIAIFITALRAADPVTVALKDGVIEGFTSEQGGKIINNFYGIPYAAPPLGSLRFKPPESPTPWSDVRNATHLGNSCMQENGTFDSKRAPSSEDCLFINVHAPNNSYSGSPLPVMVWVHGGGYRAGAGDLTTGDIVAAKDVIVVTFNYRLDVFGFLSTEDDVMPGNYGMLDQVKALNWVKDNIESFGGDSKKVTVFGESAGSTSVSLLLFSPLTEGLFHAAIMESGVSLCTWAYAHPARSVSHAQAAQLIGEAVGCSSSDSQKMLECFQSADTLTLLHAATQVSDEKFNGGILMNPRVEQTYNFLPDLPSSLLNLGKMHHVHTVHGFNENEFAVYRDFNEVEKTATEEDILEMIAELLAEFNLEDIDSVLKDMVNYYVTNLESNDTVGYAKALEKAGTDVYFRGPIMNEIQQISSAGSGHLHYLYEFGTKPEYSTQPEWITAGHAEEIPYVFGAVLSSTDPQQRNVSDTVMTFWTNFAKTGNPNSAEGSVTSNDTVWWPHSTTAPEMVVIRIDGAAGATFDEVQVVKEYAGLLEKINTEPSTSSAARLILDMWRCLPLYILLTCLVSGLSFHGL